MASFGKKKTAQAASSFGNNRAAPQGTFTARPASADLSAEAMAFLKKERARSGYEIPGKPSDGGNAHGGKPVAGRRILSYLVDTLVVGVPFCLIMWPSIAPTFSTYIVAEHGSAVEAKAHLKLLEILILHALVRCAYAVSMEASSLQATLGKMALRIVVTDKNKNKPGLFTVILRNTIARIILNAIPFYIGYFMILFDKNKKGVHDMLSGSMVCTKAPYGQSSVSEVFT